MGYVYAGQWGPEALIDTIGRPYVSTAYTVVLPGTSTPATLYTDRTMGTPQANPGLTSNGRGNAKFCAAPGFYDVQVAGVTVMAGLVVSPDAADVQGPIPPGTYVDTTTDQTKLGALRFKHVETHFDAAAYGSFASTSATTATLQAAAAAWGAAGGKLHMPGGADLTVNGLISLPQSQASSIKHWSIDGHWCKLRGAAGYAGVVLGDPLPANTAAVLLGRMLDIQRIDMIGDGATAGSVGLRVIGGQNHVIRHNKFRSFDIGLDAIFCLGAEIALNEASANLTYDILVRAAFNQDGTPLWSGATGSATASNSATIWKCRSYGNGAAVKAQIAVLDSHLASVEHCIVEGVAGVAGVLFSALNNTSAKTFTVDHLHSENFPSEAVVRVLAGGGRINISNVRNDQGAVLVDGRSSNSTTVFMLSLQSLFSTNMFRADAGGGNWVFSYPGGNYGIDPTDSALWVGATKPYISVPERLSNSTQEPGITARSTVMGSYAGGKFVAANGGAIVAGAGAVDNTVGNDGDTWVRKEGGILQRIGGAWTSVPVTSAVKTASYVLAAGDPDVIEMNVAGANTLTVPPNSSVAFPIGTLIEVYQMGAGQTTITPGSGVTLRSSGGKLKTTGQYSSASLRKRATDEWVVAGDLTT